MKFYVQGKAMYKRHPHDKPTKCIFRQEKRTTLLKAAHEKLGHRGQLPVVKHLKERFYWPSMWNDVVHHVKSCHQCQIRDVRKAQTPLMVSTPATIFTKIYVDIMNMPPAHGYNQLVAARDDLTSVTEGRALKNKKSTGLARFFFEQILCRYGAIGEVVTDNGTECMGAWTILMNQYHIPHIKISPYNSKANGVVERGHWNIREALVKSCKGKLNKWPELVPHAFFAERVTVRRQTGYSPFYLLHGVQPVLPFDLTEATFLVEGFIKNMSTSDLLALRIRQLEKHPDDLAKAAEVLKQN